MSGSLLRSGTAAMALLGAGLFQLKTDLLVWLIAGLLVWGSCVLLAMGLQRWQVILTLAQLIVLLVFSFKVPMLLFALPVSWLNLLSRKWLSAWGLIGFGVTFLLGVSRFQGQSLFWDALICGGCAVFAWSDWQTRTHRLQLQTQSDALRLERNRLAKLFSQSISNADVREQQAAAIERQRLVHEIHDQLGHQLTGGLIQLQAAKISYRRDPVQGEQLLDQSIAVVRAGIEDIREILHTESPASQTVSLARLKGELQQFTDTYAVKTDLRYSGPLERVTVFHWQVLLGNLKEILTNTLKYGGASTVTVNLHVYQRFLRFTVQNDGPSAPDFQKGIGILGMEERTATLNGQLVVDGQTGFAVTTTLPLTDTHDKSHV